MNSMQLTFDKFSIGLSLFCALHCIVIPPILFLVPGLFSPWLNGEWVHFALIILVLPSSLYALINGCCKQHKMGLLVIGVLGLVVLVFAAIWGGRIFGDAGEKGLTLMASILMVVVHIKNYKSTHSLHCECKSICQN